MTNKEMDKIFNLYNEEEIKIIRTAMFVAALANAKAPQTEEELKEFCDNEIKNHKEFIEKEERAKQKRKEAEARKAAENGMTVEEYRKEKARKAKIKRLEKEIAELEKELKNKKNYLERLTKWAFSFYPVTLTL